MTSLWSIIVPEAGSNLVLNPSAETATGSAGAYNGATVTRDTTQARYGDYCYLIAPSAGSQGASLATSGSAASATHTASIYVYGTITGSLQATMNGSTGTWNTAAIIGGATGGWVRYGASFAASLANNSVATLWRNTANENWRLDGAQIEAASYATTYIDGDAGPLYRWSGLRHGSLSTRDAQDRGGGRERDLYDTYGITVSDSTPGVGLPGVVNNLVGQALQPGAAFQSTKLMPRLVTLGLGLQIADPDNPLLLHGKRQDLIDLIKPERVRGNQPFILGYSGAAGTARKVYAAFRYDAGLEFGAIQGSSEYPNLRLLAVDPFWYEDNRETATLDFQDSVANSAYANRRTNGQWLALGTGMNSTVYAFAIDKVRGRVYFGGTFTTANGVTVNGVCYWNGTTFVAMDGGVGAGAGSLAVYTIAIAANGDVWIGGAFLTVGSGAAATKGLARWNISTGTWTAFNESTGAFAAIYSAIVGPTGQVVIAGNFTDWETDGGSDYIASTSDNGANWDSLGTQPFSSSLYVADHQMLAYDVPGNLWSGSRQTGTGTISLFKWNGSVWTTVAVTDSQTSAGINALFFDADGLLYVGGEFGTIGGVTAPYIAVYNGTSFAPLNSSLSGNITGATKVYRIGRHSTGIVILGDFTSAGGTPVAGMAVWNGNTFHAADITLPSTPLGRALGFLNDDIFLGYDTSGTATAAGLTTITPTATAPVYPSFTLIGPSSASATLQWLENQSTGHRLYFNLTVYAGETINITLTPGARQVVSDWRGVIANQPLSNSDWAAWHLLGSPASNVVAAFVTGTTTAAALLCHYQPRHLSIDGPA